MVGVFGGVLFGFALSVLWPLWSHQSAREHELNVTRTTIYLLS
jgi:hypothetical protein